MSAPPASEDLSPTLTIRHRTRLNSEKARLDWRSSAINSTVPDLSSLPRNRSISFYQLLRNCLVQFYVLIFALLFMAFFLFSLAYNVGSRARLQQVPINPNQRFKNTNITNVTNIRQSQTSTLPRPFSKASSQELEASSPPSTALEPMPARTGSVPVVYRTVLERLDELHRQQNVLASLPTSLPFLDVDTGFYHSNQPSMAILCQNSPCRYLLPLRIAEQESKARIHLLEIIQTAKRLDRILILPHVGKSRLGLCFRWCFEAYYDEMSLQETLHEKGVQAVTLEAFKHWLDLKPDSRLPRGQLVSLMSKAETDRSRAVEFINNKTGLITSVDTEPVTLEDPRLPGCFDDQFSALISSDFAPIAIYPSPTLGKSLKKQPIGEAFIAVLSQEDIRNASRLGAPALAGISPNDEPDVLMLDWGMRHPIYHQPFQGSIEYSPYLELIARKLSSQSSPYLMIHWRMESVSPDILHDCAHDLVDTISNLLHTPDLGHGIRRVWFAGDYPIPILNHIYPSPERVLNRTAIQNKSGTFKEFGNKHTEAVDVLVDAFREGAELNHWAITDLAAEIVRMEQDDQLHDVHPDFLTDSGALGILDKMVGMDAAIFVGGSKRCGRTSSFTKQVIDARQKYFYFNEDRNGNVRNVVDYFG